MPSVFDHFQNTVHYTVQIQCSECGFLKILVKLRELKNINNWFIKIVGSTSPLYFVGRTKLETNNRNVKYFAVFKKSF